MIDNIRFTLRQMRKNPWFATLAIVTLALGIGANTAMFTVIDSVVLRPLPYPDGNSIVAISRGQDSRNEAVQANSWLNYVDLREQTRNFRAIAAYNIDFAVLRTSELSEATTAVKTTADLFNVLGTRPALGRPFTAADNEPGAPAVVVLTSPFWRAHFGSDPGVIGHQVRLGETPYTIIGVLPADFHFGGIDASEGVWIPYQPDSDARTRRDWNFLLLIGTLRPGTSTQAAQAELTSIARTISQKDPQHAKELAFGLIPLRDVVSRRVWPVFMALTGALVLVLLIACANVANLQLARCLARGQELAVRAALGAKRRTLLAQMLVEGGVLCTFGAAAGLGLSQAILSGVRRLPADLIPRADEIHLRLSVFLMLLLATMIVTLLSSIVPAFVATLSDPQAILQGTRGSSFGIGRSRISSAMVVGEVALSAILLVSGGLLFRTLYNLQHLDLGFEADHITSFVAFPGDAMGFYSLKPSPNTNQNDPIALRRYTLMQERLRQIPGVVEAGYASVIPFEDVDVHSSFQIVGRSPLASAEIGSAALLRAVSGGYSRVMKTSVLRGQAITQDGLASQQYVVTINQSFAKRFFPGEDPVGQRISFGKDAQETSRNGMLQPYTIVGVLADTVQSQIGRPVEPEIDLPYSQIPMNSVYYQLLVTQETNYVVRSHGAVEITSAIRNAFRESVPDFALENFQTMEAAHDQADFNQRLGLYLVASFSLIAIVMLLAGLYGVLSQLVSQRKREIAIRMALGANRIEILSLILRRGFMLIGIGVSAGLVAALGIERSVRSFLYGVSPMDAITYIGVVFALVLVGALAAAIPARRAALTEPMQALRGE